MQVNKQKISLPEINDQYAALDSSDESQVSLDSYIKIEDHNLVPESEIKAPQPKANPL